MFESLKIGYINLFPSNTNTTHIASDFNEMPGHFHFYCNQTDGESAWFDADESRHMVQILRFREGDTISFTDGKGNSYKGVIIGVSAAGVSANIVESATHPQSHLSVASGIIKSSDRMEWMVEKCTELGVTAISLIKTKQSERGNINIARLEKVAIAAMKQSHGCWLPAIRQMDWNTLLKSRQNAKYFASLESGDMLHWKTICAIDPRQNTLAVVGPEGDFTTDEIEQLKSSGFEPVSLGNSILRTETAVVAMAAAFLI